MIMFLSSRFVGSGHLCTNPERTKWLKLCQTIRLYIILVHEFIFESNKQKKIEKKLSELESRLFYEGESLKDEDVFDEGWCSDSHTRLLFVSRPWIRLKWLFKNNCLSCKHLHRIEFCHSIPSLFSWRSKAVWDDWMVH